MITEPKRIMCLGDTHGNTNWTAWAIEYAAENGCDAIIQVGDFGLGWDQGQFFRAVNEALVEHDITLYWVDGNHENHDALSKRVVAHAGSSDPADRVPWSYDETPRIIHLPRGHRWEWWGVAWMALGGAASVDRLNRTPGLSWWPGETLATEDIEYASRPGDVDVVIAHDAPYGVDIPKIGIGTPNTDSGFPHMCLVESGEHRRAVRAVVDAVRPRLYIHGHYHLRYQAFYELPGGERTLVQGLDCDGQPLHYSTLFLNKPGAPNEEDIRSVSP
ncbi:hypothetical protein [Mycobacterium phage WXIN]|nr:hypothetical protein [Mycobacterium phage WXIN]